MFSMIFPALRPVLRSFAGKRNEPASNKRNGLRARCRMMVDKFTIVPKFGAVARVGRLDDEDILRLDQAIPVLLGQAVSPGASSLRGDNECS